jgi:hypothetical protein
MIAADAMPTNVVLSKGEATLEDVEVVAVIAVRIKVVVADLILIMFLLTCAHVCPQVSVLPSMNVVLKELIQNRTSIRLIRVVTMDRLVAFLIRFRSTMPLVKA